MTTTQKGTRAEAEVLAAALDLGLGVSTPFGDGSRYDLILDLHPQLLRVQCKWARRLRSVLQIRLNTCRDTPSGRVTTTYTPAEIDAIAAYSADTNRCYLIPVREVMGRMHLYLRLEPTLNNQSRLVWWARDHELATAVARMRKESR